MSLRTRYLRGKTTHQAAGQIAAGGPGWEGLAISGYEVHSGESSLTAGAFAVVERRSGEKVTVADGAFVDRSLFGTYLHGVFDVPEFRRAFLDEVRTRKGLRRLTDDEVTQGDQGARAFDALRLRHHLDLKLLERLTGIAL